MKKTGFTDAVLQNLAVDLNKTTTANVVIKLGTVTTTVEVVDATPSIDTTTVQVQNTYQAEQIVALPIIENSASFFGAYNLSLLGAGVASNGGVGQGQGPSIGGQRADEQQLHDRGCRQQQQSRHRSVGLCSDRGDCRVFPVTEPIHSRVRTLLGRPI